MEPEQDAAMPSRALADVEVPFVVKIELAMFVFVEWTRRHGCVFATRNCCNDTLCPKEVDLFGFFAPWKERRIGLEEGWLCHSCHAILDPLTCFPKLLWSFPYLELPVLDALWILFSLRLRSKLIQCSPQFCPADVFPPQWQDPFTGVRSRLFPISDV